MTPDRAIANETARLLTRQLTAPVLAPVGAAFCACAMSLMIFGVPNDPSPVHGIVNWFALTAATALGATIFVGMPWHAFVYRRGWRQVSAYWPIGALVGAALPATLLLFSATAALPLIAYGSVTGALTALIAWLIRRPDRDPANPLTPAP